MSIDRQALLNTYDPLLEKRLERLFATRIQVTRADGSTYEYRPPTLDEACEIVQNIVEKAADHLESCGFKSVTVPTSGGADSTFEAYILRHAADLVYKRTGRQVKIFGFNLPCTLQSDADYFTGMGAWACELYTDDWSTVNLGPAHDVIMNDIFDLDAIKMQKSGTTLNETFKAISPDYPIREMKVDRGNVAARMRMIFAYGIAKMLGGAQVSTDNLSEALQGFWTLCGDEGTFKHIQGVFKGLEQPILMYAAGIPSPFYTQKETDGLGVGDGDVSQMYAQLYTGKETYIDVDTVLLHMLAGAEYPDPLNPTVHRNDHPVVRRYYGTEFKRTVFSLGRKELGLQTVEGLKFAV